MIIALAAAVIALPPAVVPEAPPPAALNAPASPTSAPATDFRLHAVVEARDPPLLRLDDPRSPLRRRLLSSMFDFHPAGPEGLRFSAGSLRVRHLRVPDVDILTTVSLLKVGGRGGGLRMRERRYAPAATLGYSLVVGPGVSVGVDAGTAFGRIMPVRRFRLGRGGGIDSRREGNFQSNPMVQLAAAFVF